MENIHLYYFSGSGNTLKLAQRMQVLLIERGYRCSLEKMEDISTFSYKPCGYMGLFFPVALQSTYPLVWKFVEGLPQVESQKIFMVDSLQAFSGGVVGPMKKQLKAKGYTCVGAIEIKMSTSMNLKAKKVVRGQEKNRVALETLARFTDDLLSGKTSWPRLPFFSDVMRSISINRGIWIKQSQKLKVDRDLCIMCGACGSKCPVHAISEVNQSIYIECNVCESCMRCANLCPTNAFKLGGKAFYQNK